MHPTREPLFDPRLKGAMGLFILGLFFRHVGTVHPAGEWTLFLSAYFLAGGGVLRKAWRNLGRGKLFDENFLMAVATLGAIAIRELPEAVAVMLFYSVGELLQERAVRESRRSVTALMNLRPDVAHLREGGNIRDVSPEEVQPGAFILIRPGERVPLDGEVVEGKSFVDTSALTGEPVPRSVEPGDEILAGMVNTTGLLTVRVTKPFAESSAARMLKLVEDAAKRKASTERFITAFARYYTPAVVGGAAALAIIPPLLVADATWSTWIYRALVLLVISCPCALVLSVPLSYFSGIGAASRHGVLVKGATYLDALTKLHTVVFDKTGTLTRGVFRVKEVVPVPGVSKEELLYWAALAEAQAHHPIARSVLEAFGRQVDLSRIDSYEEIPGLGVRAKVDGKVLLAGNEEHLQRESVPFEAQLVKGTVVHVAVDGTYRGYLVIGDEVRDDAAQAVAALRRHGVERIIMLTGDDESAAEGVARQLDLDGYYANLLPEDKVSRVEELLASKPSPGCKLAFAGDGVNDAAVIARADIGVAMGGFGSDAAIEAADVVIVDDRPSRLVTAVRVARVTRQVVLQNIGLALGVKVLFVALGAAGLAGMGGAVVADVGVTLAAVLNAARVLRMRETHFVAREGMDGASDPAGGFLLQDPRAGR